MISIIVPVYGVEAYLPKAIDSLTAQTYRDIEIILVDDGSPDGCPEICDAYAEKDDRVCVIHQKNAGVSAARNAGLAAAHGEYIGFVDPDDWCDPEMFGGMLDAIERENADMAICGYEYYGEDGQADGARRYPVRPDELLTQKEVFYHFSDMPPTIRHGVVNKLFRRSFLPDIRFDTELHSSEDVLFLTEYVCRIRSAVMVHRPYYCNLVRRGSATHGGLDIGSLSKSYAAHDRMYRESVQRYPDIRNHAQAFLLDICALKYNEAMRKTETLPAEQKKEAASRLAVMRQYVKKHAWQALFNTEIFWKTRVAYLIHL